MLKSSQVATRAKQVHNLMWTPISLQLVQQIVSFINFFFHTTISKLAYVSLTFLMIFVKFIYKALFDVVNHSVH